MYFPAIFDSDFFRLVLEIPLVSTGNAAMFLELVKAPQPLALMAMLVLVTLATLPTVAFSPLSLATITTLAPSIPATRLQAACTLLSIVTT